jgi:outer membrane lipoprotein-sorting protein
MFMPVLAIMVFGGCLCAQTIDEILARNYQARGGLDKLKAVSAWKMNGTIVIPAQELKMPTVIWRKSPDKMRVETTFQDKTIVQAFDGEKAWWIMPFLSAEAQEMPREQGGLFREQAVFGNPLVACREKGCRVELLGREDMDGTPVFKLKLVKTDGREIFLYLEAESGLELKSSLAMKVDGSDVLAEIVYGDYRPADGVMVPFYVENRMNGKAQAQMTLETVEVNPTVEDSMFAMPEIKKKPVDAGVVPAKVEAKKEKKKSKKK